MAIVKADPRRRRQLPANGPILFWRTGQDGASKVGLVVVVNGCSNADCPCRTVGLTVYRVGDGLLGVNLNCDLIEFHFPKDTQPDDHQYQRTCVLEAELDLDTGAIAVVQDAHAEQRDEVALAWLRDEMDGRVLDHLAHQTLRHKGVRPLTRMEVQNFRRGNMVGFGEAYLHGRIDSYLIDGRRLDVLDVYCVDATCRCTEMRFSAHENGRSVGSIVVNLASPARPRFEGQPVLAQLWQAVRQRYPSLDVYRKRAAKMREAGPSILAHAEAQRRAASPAISRNQPCPCGSGKKYKRCCIGKIAQPPTI